jgi:hypothetical protein
MPSAEGASFYHSDTEMSTRNVAGQSYFPKKDTEDVDRGDAFCLGTLRSGGLSRAHPTHNLRGARRSTHTTTPVARGMRTITGSPAPWRLSNLIYHGRMGRRGRNELGIVLSQ